jgi:alcohol dehydrogenase class IV
MTAQFEFATAARIRFGAGVVKELAPAAASFGKRVLLVTGASPDRAAPFAAAMEAAGLGCIRFPVAGEPTVERVSEGTEIGRRERCDVVVAIGGGSPIDAGKALAALIANPGEPLDYLEVVGRGQPLENPALPFLAVPTTAGTGSEVTRNAVLASPSHRVKASLRSVSMLPRLALIDPELTLELPRPITASTGLDALTQVIEPYVCVKSNPMTDMFCVEGIRRIAGSLRRAWTDGTDRQARTEMCWASLLGGLSLANAGLGAVHGFAAPIGGMFPAPHGAVCAAVLPHAIEVNLRALRRREPESRAVRRYTEIARILTGDSGATAEDGVRWIVETCQMLEIPSLRCYGIGEQHSDLLSSKAAQASSMKANPIVLTPEELREIVARSI